MKAGASGEVQEWRFGDCQRIVTKTLAKTECRYQHADDLAAIQPAVCKSGRQVPRSQRGVIGWPGHWR